MKIKSVISDKISKLEEDAANNATFGKMGMGKMGMVSFPKTKNTMK